VGPAHPGHCRGCGPLSPVGRSGGGSTGRPRSCVDEQERTMNGGAATAFLPNFVAFPSLRGLNSSIVQPWRTPRPHRVRRHVRAPTGGVAPAGALRGGAGPGPRSGPRGGDAVPRRSSAAPCQLPPPHPPPPPPPQDDPPPQDEPPPQEWPEWWPPEDESPPSPAHQLSPPPLPPLSPPPTVPAALPPDRRGPLPLLVRTGREGRRRTTNALITRAATTNRTMPMTTAPPSFRPGPRPDFPRSSPPSDASPRIGFLWFTL
jgi:hypothetical protein